jgi:membrane protein DedA with SNARE-associated domain
VETALELDRETLLTFDQRQVVRRCLILMAVLAAASLVGMAGSFYLVSQAPLLLVALSPLGRHVVLAAPVVAPLALGAVLIARRQVFYGASFFLGRALGPEVIPWIEQRISYVGRFVRLIEALFTRAPRLVVVLMAGPTVSALAGVSGMALGTYLALSIISLTIRVAFMLGFAELTQVYIEMARAWVEEHRLPGTVVMVVLVVLYRWRSSARARARSQDSEPPREP